MSSYPLGDDLQAEPGRDRGQPVSTLNPGSDTLHSDQQIIDNETIVS